MIIRLNSFNDSRGCLLPIELDVIPFQVKRTFIVNSVPVGMLRGNHAHFTTKQFILCTSGQVDVIMHDGKDESTFKLIKGDGILVPELIWDSQRFNDINSEILVLCSTKFNMNDYIFDFNTFLQLKNSTI